MWAVCAGIAFSGVNQPLTGAEGDGTFSAAWEALSRMEFNEAYAGLREDPANAGNRIAKLIQGIALPNVQPRTASNFEKSIRLLMSVAEENPHDDIGAMARYYRARLTGHNPFLPGFEEAVRLYEELFDDRPDALHAQLGVTKLVILRLYLVETGSPRSEVLAELEEYGPQLTLKEPARAYHSLMGKAYLRFGLSEERALHHFLAGSKLGYTDPTARTRILIQIAVTAEKVGKTEVARAAADELVKHSPRETRARYFRQRFGLDDSEGVE